MVFVSMPYMCLFMSVEVGLGSLSLSLVVLMYPPPLIKPIAGTAHIHVPGTMSFVLFVLLLIHL